MCPYRLGAEGRIVRRGDTPGNLLKSGLLLRQAAFNEPALFARQICAQYPTVFYDIRSVNKLFRCFHLPVHRPLSDAVLPAVKTTELY